MPSVLPCISHLRCISHSDELRFLINTRTPPLLGLMAVKALAKQHLTICCRSCLKKHLDYTQLAYQLTTFTKPMLLDMPWLSPFIPYLPPALLLVHMTQRLPLTHSKHCEA